MNAQAFIMRKMVARVTLIRHDREDFGRLSADAQWSEFFVWTFIARSCGSENAAIIA
jgi:hypothetical protein